jgi:hypothetical protein
MKKGSENDMQYLKVRRRKWQPGYHLENGNIGGCHLAVENESISGWRSQPQCESWLMAKSQPKMAAIIVYFNINNNVAKSGARRHRMQRG